MRSTIISFVVILFLIGHSFGAGPQDYTVRLTIDGSASAQGSGSIDIPENRYGRIVITFYNNADFSIQTPGILQQPITFSPDSQAIYTNKVSQILDIYLKPKIQKENIIDLNGIVNIFNNDSNTAQLKLSYSRRDFDFAIFNGGSDTLALPSAANQKPIILIVSIYSSEVEPISPTLADSILFNLDYSSLNTITGKGEVEKQRCQLVARAGSRNGSGNCKFQKSFLAKSNKIIYYTIDFTLDNLRYDADSLIVFDFRASRFYGLNPADTSLPARKIEVEKGIIKTFSKTISAMPGERIEIKLPAETDSLFELPIAEKVAIYNPNEFVDVDRFPETIKAAMPVYPEQGKKLGITADVVVRVLIDKNGIPAKVYVKSCDQPGNGFEEAALASAYQCRYRPASKNGRAIGAWVTYTIKFRLN